MPYSPPRPITRRNVLAAAGLITTAAMLSGLATSASARTARQSIRNGVLEAPGARLYYETVGSGSPLLLIPGGNGTAHIMGALAQVLAERFRVITFDRRGFARSELVGAQDYRHRLQTDADDALRLIKQVAGAPAAVFGPSSGAIVALQAMTQGPSSISTLVAFEPPATHYMPTFAEGQQLLQLMYDTYAIYKRSGIAPALDLFNTCMPPETVEHFKRMRDPSNPQVRAAIEYWMEHELRQYTSVNFHTATLRTNAPRIVMAAGAGSRDFPLHPLTENLARELDASFVEFPGAHSGYAVQSAAFGKALMNLLGGGSQH